MWALYDLIEFRLTPVVASKYYDEMITVEVFGWREDGSKTNTMRFKIKGSETGYKVSPPYGTWNHILQWQVRVWWSAGSRETREDFPYIIDDMVCGAPGRSFFLQLLIDARVIGDRRVCMESR